MRVDSDPHMTKLAEMARARDLTPAAGYALGALAKIIKDSQQAVADEVKAKFDAGLISAVPSTRRMFH